MQVQERVFGTLPPFNSEMETGRKGGVRHCKGWVTAVSEDTTMTLPPNACRMKQWLTRAGITFDRQLASTLFVNRGALAVPGGVDGEEAWMHT